MGNKYEDPKCYTKNDILDNRTFLFGQIWKIRDSLIGIPDADRINSRKEHFTRCVVILDNNTNNGNKEFPIITVVPLSHRIEFIRDYDVLLLPSKDNVNTNCLLRLSLMQPVLKRDLYLCVGEISNDSKNDILAILLDKFNLLTE